MSDKTYKKSDKMPLVRGKTIEFRTLRRDRPRENIGLLGTILLRHCRLPKYGRPVHAALRGDDIDVIALIPKLLHLPG